MTFDGSRVGKRILIVDDHPLVRRGLAMLIADERTWQVVGEAGGATEALRICRETRPHAAVVDLTLKDGDGLELIKDLAAMDATVRILACSMHDESLFAERCLRAGALGYVGKHESPETLRAAVACVLGGRVFLSESMTQRLLSRSLGELVGPGTSPFDALSNREREVFEGIGKGCSTRDIATNLRLSPKTIETYRENLKAKLGLRNATELTRHAVQWVATEGVYVASDAGRRARCGPGENGRVAHDPFAD